MFGIVAGPKEQRKKKQLAGLDSNKVLLCSAVCGGDQVRSDQVRSGQAGPNQVSRVQVETRGWKGKGTKRKNNKKKKRCLVKVVE